MRVRLRCNMFPHSTIHYSPSYPLRNAKHATKLHSIGLFTGVKTPHFTDLFLVQFCNGVFLSAQNGLRMLAKSILVAFCSSFFWVTIPYFSSCKCGIDSMLFRLRFRHLPSGLFGMFIANLITKNDFSICRVLPMFQRSITDLFSYFLRMDNSRTPLSPIGAIREIGSGFTKIPNPITFTFNIISLLNQDNTWKQPASFQFLNPNRFRRILETSCLLSHVSLQSGKQWLCRTSYVAHLKGSWVKKFVYRILFHFFSSFQSGEWHLGHTWTLGLRATHIWRQRRHLSVVRLMFMMTIIKEFLLKINGVAVNHA